MSFKSKFKRFFELEDDIMEQEIEETDDSYDTDKNHENKSKNVVSLQSVQQSAKVMLVEPRQYEEAQDIADHLKNRKSVIINLQRIDQNQARRIVDFLSGTVYAIGGDIQKIGTNNFLCTPDNVAVSGDISEILNESE
ncbi:cell division inhibitor SepF [Salibacterium salarium]|uniref:Cell division protein SepF n=1 Tax=Salibacterium salarium TaxID=284579 RepID=A0A3R9P557_9BACI|nr:cell division protein SepF [Salibacterium salarium]MDQ0299056.1 cell division inhibitor SepF [Salibacterium salarium]RSL31357.1 cell division protein SepF [Salibacterium salarium]